MAKEILTNVEIKLGGTDISNYCNSVTLDDEIEEHESTCFGDTSRTYISGWSTWIGSLNGINELGTLEPLLNAIRVSTVPYSATLSILPKKGVSPGAGNPKFTGTVKFSKIPIFRSQVAAPPGIDLAFKGSGTLTRALA